MRISRGKMKFQTLKYAKIITNCRMKLCADRFFCNFPAANRQKSASTAQYLVRFCSLIHKRDAPFVLFNKYPPQLLCFFYI